MSRERQSRRSGARAALAGLAVSLRQIAYVAHLAGHRLTGRPAVALVAVAGVALAAAAFAATVGGGLVVADRSVGDRFAQLPLAERTVQVTHFGVVPAGSSYAGRRGRAGASPRSRRAAGAGRQFQGAPARRRTVLARRRTTRGGSPRRPGPLPGPCTATRCELMLVQGRLRGGSSAPFAVVGRGRLASRGPRRELPRRGHARARASSARGRRRAARRATRAPSRSCPPSRRSTGRTPGSRRCSVTTCASGTSSPSPATSRAAQRAASGQQRLRARSADRRAARGEAGQLAADTRLRLIGGETAGLLLAFAVFLAATMRRREQAAWRRLTWFGARALADRPARDAPGRAARGLGVRSGGRSARSRG